MYIKRRIAFIISFSIMFTPYFFQQGNFVFSQGLNNGGNNEEIQVLNDTISEKKDKIKQLEQSIADYKKKIEQAQNQAVSLSNQLDIIDNYLIQIELDIEVAQEKLDTLILEIDELTLSIEDKEKNIAKQKKMLAGLLRTLHYENNKKYIEIVAAYDNFSDFYNRLHYVKNVEGDLGLQAKAVRLIKEDLEADRSSKEERKLAYENMKKELQNKKDDYEEQGNYKQTLLAQTHSSELTYKTLVSNLTKQYQQIENEISSIEQEVRKKLSQNNAFANTTDDVTSLSWPTQSRYITAYFYDKSYPYRHVFEHNAIDIRAAHGTAIHAAGSGYIARARTCTTASCYAYVMIVHADGISTVYGHLSQLSVSEDQFVTRGDIIGYSGATPGTVGAGPFTTGPHLHFEVRKNGIPVNPLNYLVKDWE